MALYYNSNNVPQSNNVYYNSNASNKVYHNNNLVWQKQKNYLSRRTSCEYTEPWICRIFYRDK